MITTRIIAAVVLIFAGGRALHVAQAQQAGTKRSCRASPALCWVRSGNWHSWRPTYDPDATTIPNCVAQLGR